MALKIRVNGSAPKIFVPNTIWFLSNIFKMWSTPNLTNGFICTNPIFTPKTLIRRRKINPIKKESRRASEIWQQEWYTPNVLMFGFVGRQMVVLLSLKIVAFFKWVVPAYLPPTRLQDRPVLNQKIRKLERLEYTQGEQNGNISLKKSYIGIGWKLN